ncbi:MAG: Leucine-rich repeat (LRR) protein, partial [Nitrospinales bacterium]
NKITVLGPQIFLGLSRVSALDLDKNLLEALPVDGFSGLHGVRYLTIRENRVASVAPDAFRGLTRMTNLYLDKNSLETLPKGALNGMPLLNILGVRENRLSTIEPGTFSHMDLLRQVMLSDNQLLSIPTESFVGLHGSGDIGEGERCTVGLSGNPVDAETMGRLNLTRSTLGEFHPEVPSPPDAPTDVREFDTLHVEGDATADRITDILNTLWKYDTTHPFWTFAREQTGMPNPYNELANFTFRLFNWNKNPTGEINPDLKAAFLQILGGMEKTFDATGGVFENGSMGQKVLGAAYEGVGTCADRLSIGFVQMQLAVAVENANETKKPELIRLTAQVNALIDFIDKLRDLAWVNDTVTHNFVSVDEILGEDALTAIWNKPGVTIGTFRTLALQEANQGTQERYKPIIIKDAAEDTLHHIYLLPGLSEAIHTIGMFFGRTDRSIKDADVIARILRTTNSWADQALVNSTPGAENA